MAFKSYITYEEYQELGGKLPKDSFTYIERKAQRYLDNFTFNRIQYYTTIPDVVKECLVELISIIQSKEEFNSEIGNISSYSNSVEDISYNNKSEKDYASEMYSVVVDILPNYLVCRGVNFNAEEYIQSENNNTE